MLIDELLSHLYHVARKNDFANNSVVDLEWMPRNNSALEGYLNAMNDLIDSVKFSKYKSFESQNSSFQISMTNNISLIIGRNNSGKSSVIDVIEKALNALPTNDIEKLIYMCKLDRKHIVSGFSSGISGGDISGNHQSYGLRFLDKLIPVENIGGKQMAVSTNGNTIYDFPGRNQWMAVARNYSDVLSAYHVRRVNADRDISPEYESNTENVEQNGSGVTNLIRKFINFEKYDEKIVEDKILKELNKIMGPDADFTGIRVQQIESLGEDKTSSDKWEVFIEEGEKRFALSKSGSGLKTILLILVNLYILPRLPECSGKQVVYAFEEVENNLHPALQRRVFEYLYEYSVSHKVKIFLTTHSHVAINTFYGREGVAIYHVTKKQGVSSVDMVINDKQKLEILDDLDVKASDMFQANGIVWVEGPSDRIYIKRWLEIFCSNDIIEGQDYQFAYYGGKLLSHYTTDEKEAKTENLINVLKLNRHAAIVIDSDRKMKNAHINETKRRIRDEFEDDGSYCWITQGKEIENYLPKEAINSVHSGNLYQIGQYELFHEYIEKYDQNFNNHKVDSARKYTQYITKENSEMILDLKEKVEKLYTEIKSW